MAARFTKTTVTGNNIWKGIPETSITVPLYASKLMLALEVQLLFGDFRLNTFIVYIYIDFLQHASQIYFHALDFFLLQFGNNTSLPALLTSSMASKNELHTGICQALVNKVIVIYVIGVV